jgi:hypothetical protein
VAHGIVGLGILFGLYATYAHNGGGSVTHHLADNIAFWTNAGSYFHFLDIFTPLIRVPVGANPLLVIPFLALLVAGWGPAPTVIRRLLATSLALTIPLFVLFAERDEIRDFSLCSAAIYATCCFGARRLWSIERRPAVG